MNVVFIAMLLYDFFLKKCMEIIKLIKNLNTIFFIKKGT